MNLECEKDQTLRKVRCLCKHPLSIQATSVEVCDENIRKEYEGASERNIGLVETFEFSFENNQKLLNQIPAPETPGPSSASSSRTNSLERSYRRNYDYIKGDTKLRRKYK